MRRSRTLEVQQRRDIGRYDAGSCGGLLGFKIGIICACFQSDGIMLVRQERL